MVSILYGPYGIKLKKWPKPYPKLTDDSCTNDSCTDDSFKMNNILRLISEYQQSDYSHLPRAIYIQKYLKSFDYISELQRFLEDQNYKVSISDNDVIMTS